MRLKINWDALGIGATLACAIHCALLPLFFSSLPLLGINIIHNITIEWIMLGLALFIGSYSLSHGWKKHHHNRWPYVLFLTGIVLLVIRLALLLEPIYLLIPAVICIVAAHWLNYRLCRVHNHAHSDDCDH
ncbi:MAG: MerC domain-containing protein [Bacteroidota bacterium]